MQHPAQLLLCHQRIAVPAHFPHLRGEVAQQFCSLAAYAWCYDCGYYVCDVHAAARHVAHRIAVEYPGNVTTSPT